MNAAALLVESAGGVKQVVRGEVLVTYEDGSILVGQDGDGPERAVCEVLQTSEGAALQLVTGDPVLVWLPNDPRERGVILGRIGSARRPVLPPGGPPDELVLEARSNLTLRCGEGSITLRADGKVLLKGKDLVSHAQRINRIKGGSVAIN